MGGTPRARGLREPPPLYRFAAENPYYAAQAPTFFDFFINFIIIS